MSRKLPEFSHSVLVARVLSDGSALTAEELATRLGMPIEGVRQVLRRMLARETVQIIRFEPTPGSGPPSRVYALGPNPQKEVRREERAPRDWPEASPALLEAMDALARHGSD